MYRYFDGKDALFKKAVEIGPPAGTTVRSDRRALPTCTPRGGVHEPSKSEVECPLPAVLRSAGRPTVRERLRSVPVGRVMSHPPGIPGGNRKPTRMETQWTR
ncbi:hypothetical protein GCM10023223_05710 [Stackebrandtia albiflava]